ncbi:MAG: exodeoxyribonuclease V subunit gamma [Oscillospiraceae bacterium]|jgi:ATP-dependent helicase/nuclease subunit B|nr:exodeoxyribonuclease V subunit gamma [Oscillospiraceae bacterium]
MLHLILGRAGTGKTTYLHNLLCSFAQQSNAELLLLVPEQDSFAHERDILELLQERLAQRVEVLSFSRLANAVFRQLGGHSGREADEAAQALCMSLAVESARDKLSLFSNANERMAPGLLRLRRELAAASGDPAGLRLAAERLARPKLAELALILEYYDAILAERFGGGDPLRGLRENLETSEGRALFAGKIIALDAFHGFTLVELNIIKTLLECAADVYVTLCLDDIQLAEGALFEHTARTAQSLIAMAREAAVAIAQPLYLREPHRYRSPALAHLEQAFQYNQPLVYPDSCEDITLCAAEDIEAECAWAAQRAARLLREQPGLRCRDIAILARDTAVYERPLCAALRRVGLPMFEDARQPVAAQPLMRLISGALETAANGFTLESVMRCLKSGLLGFNEEEIALLENYALLWRIGGNAWLRPWTAHPQGIHTEETELSRSQLLQLNRLRLRIAQPLGRLRDLLHECTGSGGAAALDEFLQRAAVPAALRRLREDLHANGQPAEALELARVWDLCMSMLEQIAQALGDQSCGAQRFAALFELLLSTQTIGELPQSLDAVTFGAAERVRPQNPKVVFVMGLNDGVFPKIPSHTGLITDQDRQALLGIGFAMQDLAPQQLAMERLIAYRTLCSASNQLYCSWALRNAAGDELRPSSLVRFLRERFLGAAMLDTQFLPPLEHLEGEHAGFRLLCAELPQQSDLYYALRNYFEAAPGYAQKLAALERAAAARPSELRLTQPAGLNATQFSPSRAETYAKCPFQYFAKYQLHLQPRRTADFDPLLRGNILHTVLESLLREYGVDPLIAMTPEQRAAALHDILNRYAAGHLRAEGLPARVTYLFRRLGDICAQVLDRLLAEFRVSRFRPVAFELAIDRDQPVQPHEIPLPDGGTLRLGGKADRVDCAEINGQTYFRVVDYKSGGKAFSLGDIFDGLNLQMLVYLFALWGTQAQPFAGALPAGVLYTQASDKVAAIKDRRCAEAELAKEKQSNARAAGFVLEDEEVLLAMEEGGLGLFLPAKLGGTKNMLSLARLGKLRRAADRIFAEEAEALRAGNIAALPLFPKKGSQAKTPCDYCDYQAVCGREPEQPAKYAGGLSFDEALALIDEL